MLSKGGGREGDLDAKNVEGFAQGDGGPLKRDPVRTRSAHGLVAVFIGSMACA